ncbi:centrosome-associated protein CEP250-like [Tripterygium wilfordii]|nr:centrosome-associated protein CEP250-like [Tripterygium wilfordii]
MPCEDLEEKCANLELQRQALTDRTCHLDAELSKYRARSEEQGRKIFVLQGELKSLQKEETKSKNHISLLSHAAMEMSETLSDLHEQIQLSTANIEKQHYALYSSANIKCDCGLHMSQSETIEGQALITQKKHADIILKDFIQLQQLFEKKVTKCDDELQHSEAVRARLDSADEIQNNLESCDVENNLATSNHKFKRLQVEPEVTDFSMEIFDKISEVNSLKAENLKKEEEIQALRDFQRERESQIFIPQEKNQMEKDVGTTVKEGTTIASKTLDSSQSEIVELTDCLNSWVSPDKIIARESSNLEGSRHELEAHLSELEEENLKYVERIHIMESHSRYLIEERDSSLLELQNSRSFAMNLQGEIRKMEIEMEAQKVDLKQKVDDMKRRWLEAQEESKCLKIENSKLQGTAESLVEEGSLLQKSNIELRRQKMDLQYQYTVLQVELRESEKVLSHMRQEVEALEEKYTSFLEEIASKEKAINLELDVLVHENKTQKEKLVLEESRLNQMYLLKTVEVEKLQEEVASLTGKMSKTHYDKERTASEAVLEASHLLANNIILEAALQEARGKLKLSESSLSAIRMEYETQLSKLGCELAASKQDHEILMADREKLLNLLEDVKSNEEKQKSVVRGLELKLKSSEYESLELAEKISDLTVQLQKTTLLWDEVLALKRSLIEIRLENERKGASLQMLTSDYEKLKAEKIIFLEKISEMQKAVSELDDCKCSKIALEEKVLQLEGDFSARHTLHPQDAQLKIELAQMKRANSELQRKTESLEEEKNDYLKRVQALEDDVEQKKEVKHDQTVSQNVDNQENCNTRSSPIMGVDPLLKIQILEDKLADAMEANDLYKIQLQRLLSEGEATKKNAFEDNGSSSIERDLKDMQERYFHISLKYAELQAERDQLALKLRSVSSNGRKWFL